MNGQMMNPDQGWFVWGISAKNKFPDASQGEHTVYGIKPNGVSYQNVYGETNPDRYNGTDTEHFKAEQCDIDLLFNVDEGIMKWCMVEGDAVVDGKEAVLREVGTRENEQNDSGWVPHFVFGANAKHMSVRVTQIPIEWYGKSISVQRF